MKKEYLVIAMLGLLIAILGGVYLMLPPRREKSGSVKGASEKTADLIVSYAVETEKGRDGYRQVKTGSGTTALGLTEKESAAKTEGTGTNAYVTEIGGVKADPGKKEFWAFYVNGKLADTGAGSYKLKPYDKILWKLETY